MKKRKLSWVDLALVFLVSSLAIGFGLYHYSRSLKDYLSKSTCSTLTEIMEQQKFNFNSEISMEMNALESLAIALQYLPRQREGVPPQALQMMRNTKFEYLTITDASGQGVISNGERVDLSPYTYFQRALEGETVIGAPVRSPVSNGFIVPLATPVREEGETVGVLIASYSTEKLKELILPSYSGLGYVFIVDQQGEIIINTHNDFVLAHESNVFQFFRRATFNDYDDLHTILENMKAGSPGHTSYGIGKNGRYAHYAPLDYNGWYIFVVLPESVVARDVGNITAQTAVLTCTIFVLAVLAVLLISLLYRKTQRVEQTYLAQLEHLAYCDELTGAPTLARFKLDAQAILDANPQIAYHIVKMDIDQFKLVNQLYGYEVGNQLLCCVCDAIKAALPKEDALYARMNVDEFIVFHRLLPYETLGEKRARFLKTVAALMGRQFQFNLKIPAGRYIIAASKDPRPLSDILEKVNFAHRHSKLTPGEICDYNESLAQNALRQKEIEGRMETALCRGEFQLFLQPKYDLEHEAIAGAESLVRWKLGDETMVYPDSFIPLFEKNGFITKLDLYMFEKTCEVMSGWIAQGLAPVVVSVNFSRLHLSNPTFVQTLCDLADRHQTPHKLLEIEITESTMFNNEDRLIQVLEQLHQAGFTLSMDDFGSGYSSLGLLKNIPVDEIKIDRSFFMNANDIQRAKVIISVVMEMAHALGIHTVAEGVESREQVELLRALGCDMVQGYYYAKPMPVSEFTDRLAVPTAPHGPHASPNK